MVIKSLTPPLTAGLFSLFIAVASVHAQVVVEAKGRGKEVQYALPAGASQTTPIYFYYVSKGRDTKTVQLTLRAPQGAVGTLEVAKLKGAPARAAANLGNAYAMQLRDSSGKRNALRITADSVQASSGSYVSAQAECTPEQLEAYSRLIAAAPELAGMTPEQYCAGIGDGGGETSPTPTPTPSDGATDSVLGLLQKNTCGRANDKYLVRMKVDLSAVNPALLQNGANIGAAFSEVTYRGGKASSIKPVSDGMFAPHPLLLMSTISPYNEGIFQTKWKANGKLVRMLPVEIAAYAPYRNLLLTRSVVTSLLAEGGKATFDLTDGRTAYSVCFAMKRTRQSKNGYPIGAE